MLGTLSAGRPETACLTGCRLGAPCPTMTTSEGRHMDDPLSRPTAFLIPPQRPPRSAGTPRRPTICCKKEASQRTKREGRTGKEKQGGRCTLFFGRRRSRTTRRPERARGAPGPVFASTSPVIITNHSRGEVEAAGVVLLLVLLLVVLLRCSGVTTAAKARGSTPDVVNDNRAQPSGVA